MQKENRFLEMSTITVLNSYLKKKKKKNPNKMHLIYKTAIDEISQARSEEKLRASVNLTALTIPQSLKLKGLKRTGGKKA